MILVVWKSFSPVVLRWNKNLKIYWRITSRLRPLYRRMVSRKETEILYDIYLLVRDKEIKWSTNALIHGMVWEITYSFFFFFFFFFRYDRAWRPVYSTITEHHKRILWRGKCKLRGKNRRYWNRRGTWSKWARRTLRENAVDHDRIFKKSRSYQKYHRQGW